VDGGGGSWKFDGWREGKGDVSRSGRVGLAGGCIGKVERGGDVERS